MDKNELEVLEVIMAELALEGETDIDKDDIIDLRDLGDVLDSFEHLIDDDLYCDDINYYVLQSGIIKCIYDVQYDWDGTFDYKTLEQVRIVPQSEWNEIINEKIKSLEKQVETFKSKLKHN